MTPPRTAVPLALRTERSARLHAALAGERDVSLPAPASPAAAAAAPAHQPSIGMLSTYPPTQCGLATFSAALVTHLVASAKVGMVRVLDQAQPASGPLPEAATVPAAGTVVAELVNGSPDSARKATRVLNGFDAVVVQHEYGIFGGPDGSDVLDIVDALTVPIIVVTHTVLQEPSSRQRHILERLLGAADRIVTMTETARGRLIEGYGADPDQVVVIPHGAIDHRAVLADARLAQPAAPREERPLILTWGLLGPGKGIEWAIDAMAGLRDLQPRYLVVGRTHPKVQERHGEDYRDSLVRRAAANGVEDLVELDDSYLSDAQLADLVSRADVVLLPYDSREQVTSGVLIEAVAAGRPVVSTAFPHAVELLEGGPGLVVPQRDPAALQGALRRVLSEAGLADQLAARAAEKAPELLWGAVAARYRAMVLELAPQSAPQLALQQAQDPLAARPGAPA